MELGNKAPALCLWCFDLLHLNGEKLTLLPLDQRKALLAGVVSAADDEHLQFSGDFDDPIRLLETCGKMGFEGIVSKRKESPGSGPRGLVEDQDGNLARSKPISLGAVRKAPRLTLPPLPHQPVRLLQRRGEPPASSRIRRHAQQLRELCEVHRHTPGLDLRQPVR